MQPARDVPFIVTTSPSPAPAKPLPPLPLFVQPSRDRPADQSRGCPAGLSVSGATRRTGCDGRRRFPHPGAALRTVPNVQFNEWLAVRGSAWALPALAIVRWWGSLFSARRGPEHRGCRRPLLRPVLCRVRLAPRLDFRSTRSAGPGDLNPCALVGWLWPSRRAPAGIH